MKHVLIFQVFLVFFCACKKDSQTQPAIAQLVCNNASPTIVAVKGESFSTTISIPYSGGNALAYSLGPNINSGGVAGLTAQLQAGTLANGSGNLVYLLSGTPQTAGMAAFDISFAGKNCTLNITVADALPTQYGTPFANVPQRQDASIYQVNTRTFSNAGNLQGVLARLDSIKDLGVNVVYLMPIYPVGTLNAFNSPYCVKNHTTVSPEFGSLNDLRAVVDGAHSRNMAVILDWVANHTAWDHPWISSHSDWYVKNAGGQIVSPPGQNWNDVAQLDFNNQAMRLQMIRSMKYWVYAANIDGFRMDYADGPPFSFWKQAVDSLRAIGSHRLLLLAEGSRNDHFDADFDYTFGFRFYGQLKSVFNGQPATELDVVNGIEYSNATNGQQVVRYTTNHDVNGSDGLPQNLFGNQRGAMAAFVLATTMKGVPMVYNGQEVALPYQLFFPFTAANISWGINADITQEHKKIIAFRNNNVAVRRGATTSYNSLDVAAFEKTSGTSKAFVLANCRNSSKTFDVPANLQGTSWTNQIDGSSITLGASILLGAYEYLLLGN